MIESSGLLCGDYFALVDDIDGGVYGGSLIFKQAEYMLLNTFDHLDSVGHLFSFESSTSNNTLAMFE